MYFALLWIYFLTSHIFKKDFIHLFLERGEGREKEEKNINVRKKHRSVASCNAWLNPQSSTCPDWELNWWPFALWVMPHQLSHNGQGCWVTYFKAKLKFHLFCEPFLHHLMSEEAPVLLCIAHSMHMALRKWYFAHGEEPWLKLCSSCAYSAPCKHLLTM